MYVCVCHAVTEDDVRRHVTSGVGTAKEMRAACGMGPGCGQCVRRICAMLDECAPSGACALADLSALDEGVSGVVAA
jgi:bacterioferritin-associated ferredoxin